MEMKTTTLNEVIQFKNGKKRPTTEGTVPVYGGNGILGYADNSNYEGCIIIGRVGAYCGSVYLEDSRCWVSDNAIAALPLGDNDRHFLYYLLRGLHLNDRHIGTSQPLLTQEILNKIECSIPSPSEQRKIAALLGSLDNKIITNQMINDNLQQQLTAIFREWFIDAPESAEWPRGTFADLIDHTISGDWGRDAPTGNYTEMVYCIRGADIPEVKAGNKGKMPTRFILPKNYAAKKLVDGDIVVEISGGSPTQSTGRAAPVSESLLGRYDRGMVCTNFCKAIKPKRGYSMFVYHYWQHLYDAGVFFGYENGTTGIKNLDISGFIETEEIVLPPFDIVKRFDTACQAIANKVYANGLENERLANLRDVLLPRLMSGEIDVASIKI